MSFNPYTSSSLFAANLTKRVFTGKEPSLLGEATTEQLS